MAFPARAAAALGLVMGAIGLVSLVRPVRSVGIHRRPIGGLVAIVGLALAWIFGARLL